MTNECVACLKCNESQKITLGTNELSKCKSAILCLKIWVFGMNLWLHHHILFKNIMHQIISHLFFLAMSWHNVAWEIANLLKQFKRILFRPLDNAKIQMKCSFCCSHANVIWWNSFLAWICWITPFCLSLSSSCTIFVGISATVLYYFI